MNELNINEKSGTKFINFNHNKLSDWRDTISSYAQEYGNLYLVSDTETTDVNLFDPVSGKLNRVLEWGICFCYKDENGYLNVCKDSSGEIIGIDEPINPFISDIKVRGKVSVTEPHPESIPIHGLTLEYLFGEGESPNKRTRLPITGAPTFEVVFDLFRELVDVPPLKYGQVTMTSVFHNSPFDMRFLNSECSCAKLPPPESFFNVLDTKALAEATIIKKDIGSYTLDSIYEYGKKNYPDLITDIERPYHSAMVDSLILVQVYNIIQRAWLESI